MNPLDAAVIHLHLLNLEHGDLPAAKSVLSATELQRAARFQLDVHRNRYIRGRAALRRVLGAILECEAADVRLRKLPSGKPVLDSDSTVAFNLAHCEQRGVIAVGARRAIGVDIEILRPLRDRDRLAAKHLSPAERQALHSSEESQRDLLFLSCWTRKEAYLKMQGLGIERDLSNISVGLTNHGSANAATLLHTLQLENNAVVTVASDQTWSSIECHAAAER
jgi:4'-phosphopantetheinyl transferase